MELLLDALKSPVVLATTKSESSSGLSVSGSISGGTTLIGASITPGYITSPLVYSPSTIPTSYTGYSTNFPPLEATKDDTITQLIKALNETKLELLEDIYIDLESVTTDIGLINVLTKIKGKITRLKNKNL